MEIIVATNGCFDILHSAHCRFINQARKLGTKLVVGLNSDRSVAALKGPGRPINTAEDRKYVLLCLESVNQVEIFDEVRATEFLRRLKPDIYVKSSQYSLETLDPYEREVLEQCGAKIVFLPHAEGMSTTSVLERLNAPSKQRWRVVDAVSRKDLLNILLSENEAASAAYHLNVYHGKPAMAEPVG